MKARPFPGLSQVLRDLPDDRVPLERADDQAGRTDERTDQRPVKAGPRPRTLAPREPDAPPRSLVPTGLEKRIHTRFDKAFLVVIGSELFGDTHAVARNVSAGGILVEMSYAPPLGTLVTVHFRNAHDDGRVDEIVARAEVKHHHYLNFTGGRESESARAVGLRFVEFLDADAAVEPDAPHASVLH